MLDFENISIRSILMESSCKKELYFPICDIIAYNTVKYSFKYFLVFPVFLVSLVFLPSSGVDTSVDFAVRVVLVPDNTFNVIRITDKERELDPRSLHGRDGTRFGGRLEMLEIRLLVLEYYS